MQDFTVGRRLNEPLYNEVLGITNDFLQLNITLSKVYGTEPCNEILVITNTIAQAQTQNIPGYNE